MFLRHSLTCGEPPLEIGVRHGVGATLQRLRPDIHAKVLDALACTKDKAVIVSVGTLFDRTSETEDA